MTNDILQIEKLCGFQLPNIYKEFLINLGIEIYDIDGTGFCFYPACDLIERNTTYSIQNDEPNALMIGQDGDLGVYLRKETGEQIFSLGLGALGSLGMEFEGKNIYDFIENAKSKYCDDE